jgi:hypothetical protein
VLHSPKPSGVQWREWIQRHSRFLYFIVSRLDRLRARGPFESVELAIGREGFHHAEFAHSIQITNELMARVRARVGAIPIYAFNCNVKEPYTTALERISAHHQIQFWRDVPDSVEKAHKDGQDVLSSDGHWNELGHVLIANNIEQYMVRARYIAQRHP